MTELENLQKKLDANIARHSDVLSQGGCKDFGEYQRVCGVIYGLGIALREIEDLRLKLERLDND